MTTEVICNMGPESALIASGPLSFENPICYFFKLLVAKPCYLGILNSVMEIISWKNMPIFH